MTTARVLNKDLILKIADQVEIEEHHYDQSTWGEPDEKQIKALANVPFNEAVPVDMCGTKACIAGWAALLSDKLLIRKVHSFMDRINYEYLLAEDFELDANLYETYDAQGKRTTTSVIPKGTQFEEVALLVGSQLMGLPLGDADRIFSTEFYPEEPVAIVLRSLANGDIESVWDIEIDKGW